jgi:nucleotide-binding universal stress UspA family protein
VNAVQGSPSAVVVQRAEELGAALVVVGPTRSGAVAQFVLGTTAEQVVRHADCDVLVARPTAASGLVMVATDLSEHAMTALARAAEEARRRDAKLVAIHCLEIAHPALASFEPSLIVDDTTLTAARDACKRTIAAQLERAGAAHGEALVVQGRSGSAIPQTAEEFGADLLVVGTHGRTGLARFALGSVASTIVRVAPCPVLVVRSGPAGPAA